MLSKDSKLRRPWCLAVLVSVIIVVIVVIVVPLAVILPKKHNGHQSAVLLPLYIWPIANSTWEPLYEALTANPKLNFTVIINPSSGPGSSPYPSDQYASQVKKLNGYPNVNTVGYVRTGYATRNISTVLDEVSVYSGWASNSTTLAMGGIFFDEVPTEYSTTTYEYLNTINEAVKNSPGLQSDRIVIHNPGAIPDSRYDAQNGTDITVVFEQSYDEYQAKQITLKALPKDRTGYSYMIHSVPNMTVSNLRNFVDQLSDYAGYLFLTDLDQNYYESFGGQWANFTAVVPE